MTNRSSTVVERIRDELTRREQTGLIKYGRTVDRTDMTVTEWLQPAKEEALDFAVSIEPIITELKETECKQKDE